MIPSQKISESYSRKYQIPLQLDKKLLKQAIIEAFHNRKTTLNIDSVVFKDSFYNDPSQSKMWLAFLKKINEEPILFETVVKKYIIL
jgi:purine-nucleoside phosphorylase